MLGARAVDLLFRDRHRGHSTLFIITTLSVDYCCVWFFTKITINQSITKIINNKAYSPKFSHHKIF